MKIKVTKTYEFDIDFESEIKRIQKNFKGETRRQLLEMIDLFLIGEFYKMEEVFDNLPYDDKECHCPGQEFVGLWYHEIHSPKVIPKREIELL